MFDSCRNSSAVILLLLLLANGSCESRKGEYLISTLDVGSGRSIEILAANEMEVTQSIYYRVKVTGETVVPLFMMCGGYDTGKLRFKTITAKHGDLVGVFEQRYPDDILAVHDFSSNRSWPYGRDEHGQWGDELLGELQREHEGLKLKLGRGLGCG
jgi:hypothetical protein